MTRPSIAIGILSAALLLAGCSGLNPFASEAARFYDLRPTSSVTQDVPRSAAQLIVEEPVGARAIDTDRIALRHSAYEMRYYAGVRWSDRSTGLVQANLVEAFENSERIVRVGRQSVGLGSNYSLKSELRDFQAELQDGSGAPDIVVSIHAKLVDQPEAVIIASRTFTRRVRAPSDRFDDVVASFNEALSFVQPQIVAWTLTEMETHRRAEVERMERMLPKPNPMLDRDPGEPTIDDAG